MPIITDIITDIKNMGFSLPENIINDIENISYILTTQDIVDRQLAKLEKLIFEDILFKKIDLSLLFSSQASILNKKDKYNCFKLLSDTLYSWSQKNGFNALVGKITQFLSRDDFLGLLKNKILLKDKGAGPNHGEFTHAIQWFVITEANKELNLLSMPLSELYARIGENDCIGKSPFFSSTLQDNINTMTTIWDILVDRLEKNTTFDFRNPENACSYMSNHSSFLLLSQLQKIRYAKRITDKVNSSFFKINNEGDTDSIIFQQPPNNRICNSMR